MGRVPFTLRIDAEERAALENLSKIEGRPVNQLLNEAIKNFLSRRGPKEIALESTLVRLRAYRERDPGFRSAIAELVDTEATLEDPLEGELVEGQFLDGRLSPADPAHRPAGPVQSKIRELLGA